MKYVFNFPDMGEGLEEGTVIEWFVKDGQAVKAGDILVKMETDKVVADVPSPKTGTILKRYGAEGDVIHVGKPLVEIEIAGQAEAATDEEEAAGVVGTLEMASNDGLLAASEETAPATLNEQLASKALATPLARAMAKEMNIDINKVPGTGPAGRVSKTDIQNYKSARDVVPSNSFSDGEEETYEPLSQMRKSIARNMMESKLNAAHMGLFDEIEISELMRIRNKYRDKYEQRGVKLTYMPFIVKAVVAALKEHRQMNSQIDMEGGRMIFKNRYNIAIAVDSPEGLVVPVIKDADKLSIFQIAMVMNELAEKARNRQLTMSDMRGGTFTITNFGSIGGIFATPVINYPQAAILGVGRMRKTPVVKGDQVVVGNVMSLSLSVDHRIVDGGEVARFMNKIMSLLSDPVALLMD